MAKNERLALLSVSDKRGLQDFARVLARLGFDLLSTGGTATELGRAGLAVTAIETFTGSPEILGGRVKTLHPLVHAGILARPTPEHLEELREQGGRPIDLVVVNLYPFRQTAARPGVTLAELIEQIDIGGPSMIRGAAKNHARVGVVCDPDDYVRIAAELESGNGRLSDATRLELAKKAFAHTASYDGAIATTLSGLGPGGSPDPSAWPKAFFVELELVQTLRYGENPHQRGAFYRTLPRQEGGCLAAAVQLQGKELSYNNILDADAAHQAASAFDGIAAVVIKHTNPCGAATGATLAAAYRQAREADPVSAFGGIVGLNREVDRETAQLLAETFLEAVVAPGFEPEALAALERKKDLRLLKVPPLSGGVPQLELKSVGGGVLAQDRDVVGDDLAEARVVSARPPTEAERRALDFTWRVSRHVKSNAIVLGRLADGGHGQTVAIGAGQMSRVDSVQIAVQKAGDRARGSVLGSDAFFPFRDGPDLAAAAGVTAIVQPGGSKRDAEVIAAANEHGMAMLFTGRRHFKHG
ncbi:MAG: bifunctional phosphoribosylaminoimidazolecarboxamide formyltransferase/IMP cyclohydrolase [Deltaproteobacteria bacterium]|nr:bifunctional phosphoribosylaminoimidazolecarboxamide formyltransferase/IMP cyclohydrolase [Deltaproteobacteria bacterium]